MDPIEKNNLPPRVYPKHNLKLSKASTQKESIPRQSYQTYRTNQETFPKTLTQEGDRRFTLTDYLGPLHNKRLEEQSRGSFLSRPFSGIESPYDPRATRNTYSQNHYKANAQVSVHKLPVNKTSAKLRIDSLAYQWSKVLQFVQKNNLERAYKSVLDMNDDLYLLRLMVKTGNCMKYLSFDLQKLLSSRVNAFDNLDFLKRAVDDFKEFQVELKNPKEMRRTGKGLFSETNLSQGKHYSSKEFTLDHPQQIDMQRFNPRF